MPEEIVEKPADKPDESTIAHIDAPDISSHFLESGSDVTKSIEKDADTKPVDFKAFEKLKTDLDPYYKEPKNDTKEKVAEGTKKAEEAKANETLEKVPEKDTTKAEEPILTKSDSGEHKQLQVEDDKTKYGEAAAALFPKMAAPAREFVKARLDDIKSLTTKTQDLELKLKQSTNGLPSTYYEHPDAYLLDPRYKEAVNHIARYENEQQIWEQQLVAIRNGDKWKMPSYDEKGNIVYTEREPTPEADIYVSRMLNKAETMIEQQKYGLRSVVDNFKAARDIQFKATQEMEDKYFPAYAGDKAKDNKYIKVFKDVLASSGQENNVLTSAFSKLYAFTMEQTEYIKANESKWKQAEKTGKIAQQAGPNSGDLNNAVETKKQGVENKPFDLNEFIKAKEQ